MSIVKIIFQDMQHDQGRQFGIVFGTDKSKSWQTRVRNYSGVNKSLRVVASFKSATGWPEGLDFCAEEAFQAELERAWPIAEKYPKIIWEPMNILVIPRV